MVNNETLYHHGVKGQKWGVRRYQNPDGSLTSRGMKQYNYKDSSLYRTSSSDDRRIMDNFHENVSNAYGKKTANIFDYKIIERGESAVKLYHKQQLKNFGKNVIKLGSIYVGTKALGRVSSKAITRSRSVYTN